jgi:UV DNA damage endonuclease
VPPPRSLSPRRPPRHSAARRPTTPRRSTLRALEPPVFTSRDCIKRTLDAKGPEFLGALCLANCRDLAKVIQWNHEHSVRLFRVSSVLWPWMGALELAALPQRAEIAGALRFAGDLARAYHQRLTFQPSHFVKLAAPSEALAAKSAAELEAHSQILDLVGYEPSPVNKINIHVGGVYKELGGKAATLWRWAAGFARLSPACRARVTVENDDVPNSFPLEDLLPLHAATGVQLVFDFHHHRFCPGGLAEEQALRAALATWPHGERPVVHWSESQAGRRPRAHSDFVKGPIFLHGFERNIDVMIEAKAKEQALLAYRDGAPIPQASYF